MALLPAPLTSFVGRAAERAALAAALREHRLVTAVGPGGVGKTRLALSVTGDVAGRYADGAWYVDLVPVTDPVFGVPGLSIEGDGAPGDAVELFAVRAAAAGVPLAPGDMKRAAAICRGLDGMALAIELTAARFPSLGLDGIEAGLADRMNLLAGGRRADDRHRSLPSRSWTFPSRRADVRRERQRRFRGNVTAGSHEAERCRSRP